MHWTLCSQLVERALWSLKKACLQSSSLSIRFEFSIWAHRLSSLFENSTRCTWLARLNGLVDLNGMGLTQTVWALNFNALCQRPQRIELTAGLYDLAATNHQQKVSEVWVIHSLNFTVYRCVWPIEIRAHNHFAISTDDPLFTVSSINQHVQVVLHFHWIRSLGPLTAHHWLESDQSKSRTAPFWTMITSLSMDERRLIGRISRLVGLHNVESTIRSRSRVKIISQDR